MARKNRQLKEKRKFTWKFYTIISSCIALVIIAGLVTSICLYNHFNTGSYTNMFPEWTEHKINADDMAYILQDEESATNIFVFAYDENFMNQDAIDDLSKTDPSKNTYEETLKWLKNFYDAVEENNKNNTDTYTRVDFYVINTTLQGNSTFLSNEAYGNVTNAPSLIYFYGEEQSDKSHDDDETYTLTGGKGSYKDLTSVLKDATTYVKNLNVNE